MTRHDTRPNTRYWAQMVLARVRGALAVDSAGSSPWSESRDVRSKALTDAEMLGLNWEREAGTLIRKGSVGGHMQYTCAECGYSKKRENFIQTHSPQQCCMLAAMKTNGFKVNHLKLSIAAGLPKTWRQEINHEINAVTAESLVSH